ncbi:MAG: hypothetical protein KDB22_15045 [Planctomycetales bacterium]|nr:hypothetical protein [Planctomycetales bacterium]
MNSQTPSVQRSWTDQEQPGPGKLIPILLLTLLLVAGLVVFAMNVGWQSAPRTFVYTVSISQYDEVLPDPAFATWKVTELIDAFPGKGLVPWGLLNSESLTNEVEIRNSWKSLESDLQKNDVNERDTVIVYLRGHAIVYGDEAYLLAGEFAPDDILQLPAAASAPLAHAVPFTEILSELQHLPAGNVLLIADVCDQPSLPRLGVVANNVPELLRRAAAKLDSNSTLWIMTATDSLQPAHSSFKAGKTLLQAACEFACSSSESEKQNNYLSLADFYDAVLRYCHQVSESAQTPLLFRSGSQDLVIDSAAAEPDWNHAREVVIAQVGPIESGEEAADAANAEAAAVDSATASSGQANAEVQDENAEQMATSPWLRYWQVHDQLISRREAISGGWSPEDFAVEQWHLSQREAKRFQWLRWLDRAGVEGQMRTLTRYLEELQQQMEADGSGLPRVSAGNDLSRTWELFQQELSRFPAKQAWADPGRLAEPLRAPWQVQRDHYRKYLHAMASFSSWLEYAANQGDSVAEPGRDRAKFLQLIDDLSGTLQAIERELPAAQTTSMLAADLDPLKIAELQTRVDAVERFVSSQVDEICKKLSQARLPTGKKLSWRDERRVHSLLGNANLSYPLRKRLAAEYDAISTEHLIAPGTKNIPLNREIKLPMLLNEQSAGGTLEFLSDWTRVFHSRVDPLLPTTMTLQAGSANSLNKVGLQLVTELESYQPKDSIEKWKLACLYTPAGLKASTPALTDGLILQVSDDFALDIQMLDVVQLATAPSVLRCQIVRSYGEAPKNCSITWELIKGDKLIRGDSLRVSVPGPGSLSPNQPHTVALTGGMLQFEIAADVEPAPVESRGGPAANIELRISFSEDPQKPGVSRTVQLLPPNPDRVDLFVRQIDRNDPTKATEPLFAVQKEFGFVVENLGAPALGANIAKSTLQLNLVNRFDKAKHVIASIYDVQTTPDLRNAGGDGRITSSAALWTMNRISQLTPAFVTAQPLSLEPIDTQNPNRNAATAIGRSQSVVLVANERPNAATSPGSRVPLGEFGVLCLIEEVQLVEGAAPRRTGKQWPQWLECVPLNPTDGIVAIELQDVAREFLFEVSIASEHWTRWQLEEVVVSAVVTDLYGKTVPSRGSSQILLTPDAPSNSIRLEPERQPVAGEKLVAHLSVANYPRAIAYESRLREKAAGSNVAGTVETTQTFAWVDETKMACKLVDPQAAAIELLFLEEANAYVVPTHMGASQTSRGAPAKLATLTVPLSIDFPRGSNAKAVVSLGNLPPTELRVDRKYTPTFEIAGGNLVFNAIVRDHSHVFDISSGLRGRQDLAVKVDSRINSSQDSVSLVFDTTPPRVAKIQLNPTELYAEDTLELSVDMPYSLNLDSDTPIEKLYFAINTDNRDVRIFDENDRYLDLEIVMQNGRRIATLEAKSLLTRPPGRYWIVARTVDMAGNVQDENTANFFDWIKVRPAAPVEPVKPQEKTPPADTGPKKYSVNIQVTAAGKQLSNAQLNSTELTGISGARKSKYPGGTWALTLVPEGSYEVKAAMNYNGRKFEGNATVNVTGNVQAKIDMKPE